MFSKILKTIGVVYLIVIIFLVIFTRDTHGLYPVSDSLLQEINGVRSSKVGESWKLDEIAQKRADFLFEHNQWSHEGFPSYIRKDFTGYWMVGEILAKDFKSNEETVNAWLRSESHRNVMLSDFEYSGVGRRENIVVVLFSK